MLHVYRPHFTVDIHSDQTMLFTWNPDIQSVPVPEVATTIAR